MRDLGTIHIVVRRSSCDTYLARCGKVTASCTAGPRPAAERLACKIFECSVEHLLIEESTGGPVLFYASPSPSQPMPKAPSRALSTTVKTNSADVIDIASASPPVVDPWSKARRYIEAATLFQRASLAAQIMAGFELAALHKDWGVKRGGDRKSGSKPHDAALINWSDAVQQHLGISPDTAARWMEMAKAAKPRLSKSDLDLGTLLEKHPGTLTPAEQELLKKAVHQISDGRTQMEFMLECCGEKPAPKGPKPANGPNLANPGEPNTPAPEPLDADVAWWAENLPELNIHLSLRATWTKLAVDPAECPRANLTNLRDLLSASLEAINAHLDASAA